MNSVNKLTKHDLRGLPQPKTSKYLKNMKGNSKRCLNAKKSEKGELNSEDKLQKTNSNLDLAGNTDKTTKPHRKVHTQEGTKKQNYT